MWTRRKSDTDCFQTKNPNELRTFSTQPTTARPTERQHWHQWYQSGTWQRMTVINSPRLSRFKLKIDMLGEQLCLLPSYCQTCAILFLFLSLPFFFFCMTASERAKAKELIIPSSRISSPDKRILIAPRPPFFNFNCVLFRERRKFSDAKIIVCHSKGDSCQKCTRLSQLLSPSSLMSHKSCLKPWHLAKETAKHWSV